MISRAVNSITPVASGEPSVNTFLSAPAAPVDGGGREQADERGEPARHGTFHSAPLPTEPSSRILRDAHCPDFLFWRISAGGCLRLRPFARRIASSRSIRNAAFMVVEGRRFNPRRKPRKRRSKSPPRASKPPTPRAGRCPLLRKRPRKRRTVMVSVCGFTIQYSGTRPSA